MSWTLSIPPTPQADFAAAVDAATVSGQDEALPEVAAMVADVKAAVKELAKHVTRPKVAATCSGHVQVGDQAGPTWYEGASVSVSGLVDSPLSEDPPQTPTP